MKRPRIDVNLGELDQLLEQAQQAPLSEPDCNKIKTTLHTLVELLIAKRHTEKTSALVGPAGGDAAAESSDSAVSSLDAVLVLGLVRVYNGRDPHN